MTKRPTADDPRPAHRDFTDDALAERRVGGEQVYRGALLDVRRDRARLPDGGEAVREYIVHPGAVLVVPVLDDGRLLVVRQFRYPHDRTFIEFPAGKLDAGESALETGVRELAEEAGYEAIQWTRLGVVHPVISYSTETIWFCLAEGLSHVGAQLDEGEFLELMTRSEAELYAALDEGRLSDAKTIAALAIYSRWMSAPRRSIRLRVSGRVQGVGYRDWVLRRAQAAGVRGWVRNLTNGTVEAHVEGERNPCDRFVAQCREGPRAARVTRIEIERTAPDAALTGFDQRPSE